MIGTRNPKPFANDVINIEKWVAVGGNQGGNQILDAEIKHAVDAQLAAKGLTIIAEAALNNALQGASPCQLKSQRIKENDMKNAISTCVCVTVVLLAGVAAVWAQAQTSSSAGVQVNPAQVQKKATMPPPSSGTTKTNTVGQNVKMATPPDSDSWAEQIDMDGNGTMEQANLVWDGSDKVLLASSSGTFTCSNGTTGTGELLVAVNGTGNTRGRPVGSGFWVASMDKGQCGIPSGATWGCKFNASGTATMCGVATIDQKNDDLIIVTAQR